jgi:hypothetical protein
VRLCLEEMAPGLPGEVVRAQAEALVEAARVPAGWEVVGLEPVPVGIVSALIVELEYPIR